MIPSTLSGLHGMDASPDHAKLLVSAADPGSNENGFWTLPLKGGSPERLGTITGRDASWSADGQAAGVRKRPKLFIADADGSHASELFTGSGAVFASTILSRWSTHSFHGRGCWGEQDLSVGSSGGWVEGSPVVGGLDVWRVRMLRKLDCRRALLHFSSYAEHAYGHHHSVGFARAWEGRFRCQWR